MENHSVSLVTENAVTTNDFGEYLHNVKRIGLLRWDSTFPQDEKGKESRPIPPHPYRPYTLE